MTALALDPDFQRRNDAMSYRNLLTRTPCARCPSAAAPSLPLTLLADLHLCRDSSKALDLLRHGPNFDAVTMQCMLQLSSARRLCISSACSIVIRLT